MCKITTISDLIAARNKLNLKPNELAKILGVTTNLYNRCEKIGMTPPYIALSVECLLRRAAPNISYARMSAEELAERQVRKRIIVAEKLEAAGLSRRRLTPTEIAERQESIRAEKLRLMVERRHTAARRHMRTLTKEANRLTAIHGFGSKPFLDFVDYTLELEGNGNPICHAWAAECRRTGRPPEIHAHPEIYGSEIIPNHANKPT